jgi:hypothetical protein
MRLVAQGRCGHALPQRRPDGIEATTIAAQIADDGDVVVGIRS